jgi:NAD(P)-dependent dehydrogenase (short-subunit alcohol dehydrogenase family)
MCSETNKVAIITGASSGIGAGLVAICRQIGYHVVANSHPITGSTDPDESAGH